MNAPERKPLSALVDARLGKPFCWGSSGPESFYCLGLFLDLFRETTGLALEDPFLGEDHVHRLAGFYRQFLEISGRVTQPLDLIFYRRLGVEHVSIVEDDRWAVVVDQEAGVVRRRLRDELVRAEKLYRLKELVTA